MERRRLLKAVVGVAATALVPRRAIASWTRFANTESPALDARQMTLISAIADTLLPRTETPGALDVGVPAFVSTMATESFTASERKSFISGLVVIETYLRDEHGREFVNLDAPARAGRIATIEDHGLVYRAMSKLLRHGEPRRTYWQLKELIVHGYFTSPAIGKNILHDDAMLGTFNGAAPFTRKINA